MADIPATICVRPLHERLAMSPFVLAVLATLVMLGMQAWGGFETLRNTGVDNDSLLRLAEVRDLLGGQSWFDTTQYRMGAEGGTIMHWSRLIDAPIALLILLFTALTGSVSLGEDITRVVWPALIFLASLYFMLRAARRLRGDDALLPAAIIGALALYTLNAFVAARLDHHNVQIMLMLASLTFLMESVERPRLAFFGGIAAGFSIAIGMETFLNVAFAGIVVAGWYLLEGRRAAPAAAWFGVGLGSSVAFGLLATKQPSHWFVAECDAISIVQFAIAGLGGLGLAALTRFDRLQKTIPARATGLTVIGLLAIAMVLTTFPQCLAPPYSEAGERLRNVWMQTVVEAQPIWRTIYTMPVAAISYYTPGFIGLAYILVRALKGDLDREGVFAAAFLLVTALVSIYQLRGVNFFIAIAVVPLAAMVASQRQRALLNSNLLTNLRLAGAWLVSINIIWLLAALMVANLINPGRTAKRTSAESCELQDQYTKLAAMPVGVVATISNLGASIVVHTPHRALAGPYHRNVAGNLQMLDILDSAPEAAHAVAKNNGVSLFVLCRGNSESNNYASDSLQAELMKGNIPAWLTLVPETANDHLQIYRIEQ